MRILLTRWAADAVLISIMICFCTACGDSQPQQPPAAKRETAPKQETGQIVVELPEEPAGNSDFSSLSFGSARSEEKKENPMPKVTVQTDHINRMTADAAEAATAIQQKRRSKWIIKTPTPAGSTAEKLFDKAHADTRLVWAPLECSSSIVPIRIPDIRLSPDRSVIAFVEMTGSASGPFGSRIISINTHDWHILRITELPDRQIERIEWIPGTTSVAALCSKQLSMKQPYGIALFDLVSGKEKAFLHVPDGAGSTAFLADAKKRILLDHPDKPELIVLDAATLQKHPSSPVHTSGVKSVIAVSPDQKFFAVAPAVQAKHIEIFKTDDLQLLTTAPIPENFPLKQIFFLPRQGKNFSFFLCGHSASGDESVLIIAGGVRILKGWAAGLGAISDDGSTIYNLLRDQNRISVIDTKSGRNLFDIEANRAEPRLNNPPPGSITFMALLPEIQAFAVFDSQGTFYLLSSKQGSEKRNISERAILFKRHK